MDDAERELQEMIQPYDVAADGDAFARRVARHVVVFRERLTSDGCFPSDLADEITREFAFSLLWPARSEDTGEET